jgi:ribosomal protein L7/L12
MTSNPTVLIIAASVAAVVLVLIVVLLKPRRYDQIGANPYTGAKAAPVKTTLDNLPAHVTDQITRLIQDGRKIEAIKVLRDHTSLGLKEAKDIVERWDMSAATPPSRSLSLEDPIAELPAHIRAEIDSLVAEGKLINAIKALREHTGLGLKEAKGVIDNWPR